MEKQSLRGANAAAGEIDAYTCARKVRSAGRPQKGRLQHSVPALFTLSGSRNYSLEPGAPACLGVRHAETSVVSDAPFGSV